MTPRSMWAAVAVLTVSGTLLPPRISHAQQPAQGGGDESPAENSRQDGIPGGQMVRGVVTAVSADHLQIRREDGQTYQVVATANTRIMKQRQPIKLNDLKPGDGLGAAGVLDPSTRTLHALVIFAVDAADLRKAQQDLGKTYITGKLTAINDLQLVIARPDGVSQTIVVDEDTSFRRGGRGGGPLFGPANGAQAHADSPAAGNQGESITLADLKPGDSIFATGTLKAGVFHPTELHVGNPHHRREGASNTRNTVSPRP